MMNTRKLLILILSVTAIVQITILTFYYTSQPTMAQGFKSSQSGIFLAATALENSSNDLLWIINLRTHQIGVFKANKNGQIANLATADLAEIFFRETTDSTQPAGQGTSQGSGQNLPPNPPAAPGPKPTQQQPTP